MCKCKDCIYYGVSGVLIKRGYCVYFTKKNFDKYVFKCVRNCYRVKPDGGCDKFIKKITGMQVTEKVKRVTATRAGFAPFFYKIAAFYAK